MSEASVADRTGLRRYLAMPAFLAAVCLALYLFLSNRELDNLESQRLNATYIADSVARHLYLVAVSTVLVLLIAVPLGILLTRPFTRRLAPFVVTIANTGQAIPSVGVIILLGLTLGFGLRYAIAALVVYAFLPVLRNTMVGLQQVDPAVIEAGRGMGMSKRAVLAKIELPLAVPVVLARREDGARDQRRHRRHRDAHRRGRARQHHLPGPHH